MCARVCTCTHAHTSPCTCAPCHIRGGQRTISRLCFSPCITCDPRDPTQTVRFGKSKCLYPLVHLAGPYIGILVWQLEIQTNSRNKRGLGKERDGRYIYRLHIFIYIYMPVIFPYLLLCIRSQSLLKRLEHWIQ